ncbi:hypothetical protein Vretifemale_13796 [Volvox reticuliferus]|uniref:Uncharacterized protein n=1 Tax=Volvox reticuliferus TaxID=1737510 RepID=A0A8J4FUY6_9CHLO|nr:hypothetical protein Vretifemale_13796 [Volvox reticuliferus]
MKGFPRHRLPLGFKHTCTCTRVSQQSCAPLQIDELNADIDRERGEMAGRDRFMRDYPDVTNEFLHFFLDGIMEAMEKEQAASVGGSGGSSSVGGMMLSPRAATAIPCMRPRSSGSSGSSKERFSNIAKRMPL